MFIKHEYDRSNAPAGRFMVDTECVTAKIKVSAVVTKLTYHLGEEGGIRERGGRHRRERREA